MKINHSVLQSQISVLHADRASQQLMASTLDVSITTIRRIMKTLGLKGYSIGTRDFKLNSNIFDIIDDEFKAYWLGFLLADGCIAKSGGTRRSIKLSIQDRDKQHLLDYSVFINYKGKLYKHPCS